MTDGNFQSGLKDLVINGLDAVGAAADAGKESAAKIRAAATSPALLTELDKGTAISATWAERIAHAREELGEQVGESGIVASISSTADKLLGANDNHIIAAIYKTAREISEHAKDDLSRDLGIIASGQLALHYYVASFGTLANYLRHLGQSDSAAALERCAQEAKAEDERHTQLAEQLLQQG